MPKATPQLERRRGASKDSESPRPARGIEGFFLRRELTIIVLLCVLASVRVLVFSTAFPPFSNVDEPSHYALICDYAEGHMPTGLETFNSEASRVVAWYSSPEYLTSQERVDQGLMSPPLRELPPRTARAIADRDTILLMSETNAESTQPPMYYSVAAAWYKLGESIGFADGHLFYWVRFLNVAIYGLLVWIAYVFLRRLYPGNPLLRMGVPLLLAFFPQDVFYNINNDVLTPMLFTVALYSLLRIHLEERKSYGLCLTAGLSVAAVSLVKFSNITILVPMAIILFTALMRARALGELRKTLPRLGVTVLAAAVPVALWLWRNHLVMGDLGGGYEKARYLGWTYKPFAEVFHHPVFTPAGAYAFISELLASFWRGELVWHLERITTPACDIFYTVSTLLFVTAAVVALLWRREQKPAGERYAGWMGISVLAASLATMLVLSISFDFGHCFYPSTEHPYFTSGRLMSGAMVPFLVLYITGLDFLMTRTRLKFSRLSVLLVIVALVTASEIALNLKVFASPFNLFHL